MSYVKQEWKYDTPATEEKFNHIEEGIYGAHQRLDTVEDSVSTIKSAQIEQDRVIKRMMLDMYINDRDIIGGQGLIYDTFDGMPAKNIELDLTETHLLEAIAAGTSELPVDSTSGFKVGQEITIYDDVNAEDVMVQTVATDSITVSALLHDYKRGAVVCRSSTVTGTGQLECGSWGTYSVVAEVI